MMFTAELQAQNHTHSDPHTVFSLIDDAKMAGRLSLDESILQKFYAGYRPELLNSEFKQESKPVLVKCMVPAMKQFLNVKDELTAFTSYQIEEMVQQSRGTTEFSYTPPSGNFVFHYDTTGTHAVPTEQSIAEAVEQNIPDYIYHAAFAADSSYRYQVEKLGFTDFVRDRPYEIEFRNFGFYGTTTASGSTTFITVHSNFNGFPPNTHPEGNRIGALYVTMAHEVKHAIQYAANRWRGSAGSFDWIEMDATLMEEIVHDDVNDYYNYIRQNFNSDRPSSQSIFGNPQNPTPGAYWHITWMLYFAEEFGMQFWVDVWEDIRAEPLTNFANAVEAQLIERGERFATGHLKNHLWHLGSGEQFIHADFGFREREFYPNASISGDLFSVPDSISNTGLRPLAANYIQANAPTMSIGQPGVRIEATVPGVGIGLIGIFNDGTARKLSSVNENSATQRIQTSWNWSELAELKIAVVNTNRSETADYTLTLESVLPKEDILAQNYPNPFNPTTRIEFSVNSRKDVRIDVYDAVGRRVSTLLNEPLNEGFHFVDFDGSNLASGAYFYRIITDQTVTTNKMMLIK